MPPRDTDEMNARLVAMEQRIEAERIDVRIVIGAQAECTRVLAEKITKFEDKLSIVEDVQADWREQRAARAAWARIMEVIRWGVVVIGGILAGIVTYTGMHK